MNTTWYLHSHLVWLKLSNSSIDGTPFRVLWRLTIRSFVDGLRGFDRRKRQTLAASPAEPGDLLFWFRTSNALVQVTTSMTQTPITEEIHPLEDRRYAAMLAGDVEALDTLLDDDLVYTHSSGTADTKQSYLAGVRDKIWEYLTVRREDERITVRGDTALVHSRLVIDIRVRGAERPLDNRALAVWVRAGGTWRLLALHSPPTAK